MTCKLWAISGVSYKVDYLADELNTYQHSIKVNENTKTKRPIGMRYTKKAKRELKQIKQK